MILFSADPHFGRENILRTCARPFVTVQEMNARILCEYQRRIRPEDDFYLLGDLAHKTSTCDEAAFWFDQIPGRKHLIRGNHDLEAVTSLPWESVRTYHEMSVGGVNLVLHHYPMITWNQAASGSVHLFGHVHTNWPGSCRSVNVGVDACDYAPVSVEEIMRKAATLPPPPFWDVIEPTIKL